IAADGVRVKKIGHTQLAEAEFQTPPGQLGEDGGCRITLCLDRVLAEGEYLVQLEPGNVRRVAEVRASDYIEIGEAGEPQPVAEAFRARALEIEKDLGALRYLETRVKRQKSRRCVFSVGAEAIGPGIEGMKIRMRLENDVGLARNPPPRCFRVRKHRC